MRWGTGLTLLASIVVGLLMIEAFLRFDDYSALTAAYSYYEWGGRPRRTMVTAEELADPRPPVVVLGDSMVAGVNCGHEQNLVGHFGRAMQPVAAGYKVLNLGSANSSVFAYLDQLQGFVAANGAPAGIIVMLYANDVDVIEPQMCRVAGVIENSDRLTAADKDEVRAFCRAVASEDRDGVGETPWFAIGGPVDRWLYAESYAYRFLRESLARLAFRLGGGEPIGRLRYPALWSDPESREFRLVAAGLSEIKALADRQGIPMMVAFYPPTEFLSRDNPMYQATEAARRELMTRLHLPVLNGFDAYVEDARASVNMARSLTDAHPNCLAHRILAEWLVEKYDAAGGFQKTLAGG